MLEVGRRNGRIHCGTRAVAALLLIASLLFVPERIEAQGFFTFPDATPDYAHYETPSECLAAVNRVRYRESWGDSSGLLPHLPVRPVPPAVYEIAQRCGSHFTVNTVSRRDLRALARVAVAMKDDTLAAAALRLRAAALPTIEERASQISDEIVHLYLDEPTGLAASRLLTADLDAMGAKAFAPRLQAHWWLLTYTAATLDPTMLDESKAILGLLRSVPETQRLGYLIFAVPPIWYLSAPVLMEHGIDSAIVKVKADMRSLFGPKILDMPAIALLGKPAPALTGDFWYGRAPGDSVIPRKGVVTFVYISGAEECTISCASNIAVLRHLKRRFGDKLDVIIADQTRGYFRNQLLTDPSAEADAQHDSYSLHFEQLPMVLSISRTPFTRLPDPDRRRVNGQVPNRVRQGPVTQFIVDQRGRIVFTFIGGFGLVDEPAIGEFISALVEQGSATTQ